MSPFRVVAGAQAGPGALGVLVPPGRRTTVVLRPKALDVDLVPLRPGGDKHSSLAFLEISRLESDNVVQRVRRALESWVAGGVGRVEAVAVTGGGYFARAEIGPFTFLACPRLPGQPYRPANYATVEEALALAEAVAAVLCPTEAGGQEIYFNTRQFQA